MRAFVTYIDGRKHWERTLSSLRTLKALKDDLEVIGNWEFSMVVMMMVLSNAIGILVLSNVGLRLLEIRIFDSARSVVLQIDPCVHARERLCEATLIQASRGRGKKGSAIRANQLSFLVYLNKPLRLCFICDLSG